MEKVIKEGKKIYIRNAGKDEYWLQDRIFENPSRLGLGDLTPIHKEKKQSTGGKLDILLKDPEDNSMFEVEVMLGDTDPSHVLRTIEYWDLEKRRYPQRQHFAVLVAETFNRRYFNVIQILSLNIPMIAIQADLIEVGDDLILNFTKILDIYEEPADEDTSVIVTESTWKTNTLWTLQTAQELLELLNKRYNKTFEIIYTQTYISLSLKTHIIADFGHGRNTYWFNRRAQPKSYFNFREKHEEKTATIKAILDKENLSYSYNKYKEFSLTIDTNFIKSHGDLILKINEIRFKENSTD